MFMRILRNLLMILIVFVLGNALLTGYTISKSIDGVKSNIYSSFDTVATIQGDSYYETHQSEEQYYELYEGFKKFLNECAKDEAIKFSSISTMLEHTKIKEAYGKSFGNFDCKSCVEWIDENEVMNGFDLIGTNTPEIIDEITQRIQLTEGRNFTKDEIENENVVIIPENLVDEEGKILKVGDYITIEYRRVESGIYRKIIDDTDFVSPTIVLKIVGKFKVIDEKHDIEPYPYSYKIYVPNQIVENFSNMIMSSYEKALNIDDLMALESKYYFPIFLPNTILSPYFVLNSFEEAEGFKERTEELLNKQPNIKDYYQVVTNNDTVIRILKPLESIEKISNILSVGSFISIGFILFLLIGLFIGKSSHEIALYRALGQKKSKLILKYCGEVMIIILISLAGIRISSTKVCEIVSNKLIENIEFKEIEIEDDYDYFDNDQNLLDPNQIENKDIRKSINVEINNFDYLLCGGYILIISIIGCVFIIIKILKTNVKDLLN